MSVEQYIESMLGQMRDGADANTLALIEECAQTFKRGEYVKAGGQLGVIAARTGKTHLLTELLQKASRAALPYQDEVRPAPLPAPAAFSLLPTDESGGVAYDCYLCKLEERESCHFKGMPPGYDFGSKLPVCDEHAGEPTSVRSPALLAPDSNGNHPCGRCRVEFNVHTPPPMLIEHGREYNIQAHVRPSDFICNNCTLALCRELIAKHETKPARPLPGLANK